MLRLWTIGLALGAFWLTLLGTFMTRSGVFNSVHSFTQSPIGPVFLIFIAICLVASVTMLVSRGSMLVAEGRIESTLSRDTAFLVNNLVFVAFTFTVLIGTVYPLLAEAIRGIRVSVGEPYFNKMSVPICAALLFLMGVGPVLPWGQAKPEAVRNRFIIPAAVGLLVVGAAFAFGLRGFWPLTVFGLCGFATVVTLAEMVGPVRQRMREHGAGAGAALAFVAVRGRRRFGGYIVHLGVVMVAIAVASSSNYVKHAQKTLTPGQSFTLGGYTATFRSLVQQEEAHRFGIAAAMDIRTPSGGQAVMYPRVNYYPTSRDPMGSPDVRSTPFEDLYLTLLSHEKDGGSVTINAWVFPMVGWIWGAIPVFVFGSLFSLWPSRRLARPEARASSASVAAPPAPEPDGNLPEAAG
jgi:cytochrome c-type biogenesis protein CcmF